jgi:hypothetical protein
MSNFNEEIFRKSDLLAEELLKLIDIPLLNDSNKIKTADVTCSLSFEHWSSVRALLECGFLPSALVIHRAQFEALVRSIWMTYAASDDHINKLSGNLTMESEQAAKNIPQVAEMLSALEKSGPREAYNALSRFKDNSWKQLNSYVHAGIHPIRRHSEGYPIKLIYDVLRNSNGLAVMSAMQAVVLSGVQPMQKNVLELASQFSECMPPPL